MKVSVRFEAMAGDALFMRGKTTHDEGGLRCGLCANNMHTHTLRGNTCNDSPGGDRVAQLVESRTQDPMDSMTRVRTQSGPQENVVSFPGSKMLC